VHLWEETRFLTAARSHSIAQTMQSLDRTQVPDLPDLIIAATALYHNIPLISRDRKIQLSTINTIL